MPSPTCSVDVKFVLMPVTVVVAPLTPAAVLAIVIVAKMVYRVAT
jgi:hypothetical protein